MTQTYFAKDNETKLLLDPFSSLYEENYSPEKLEEIQKSFRSLKAGEIVDFGVWSLELEFAI